MTVAGASISDVSLVLYCLLFLACAVSDFLWLRIPNVLVLALVVLFAVCVVLAEPDVQLWRHMVPAFAALAVGAALFSLNLMPGGDVKLLSAAILWTGLDVLPSFLIWVGVAGLIITLLFVTARRGLEALVIQLQASFRLSSFVPLSLAERRGYVPYGVVIAAASIAVVERIPLFG